MSNRLDQIKARFVISTIITVALAAIAIRSIKFYIKDKLK